MAASRPKCIIVLSNKSSGSSACQSYLAQFSDVRHVERTRHFANETLYWTKAASVMGRPQLAMLDSEVPIPPDKAREDLVTLLGENLPSYHPPADDAELIFGGWKQLCEHYAPVFLEKSPHHLYQWSALELIVECIQRLPDVDFCLIGLVRNPMDVLYSSYRRWKTLPELGQHEWVVAYRNLQRLRDVVGDRLVTVRYEDMVSDPAALEPVYRFLGVPGDRTTGRFFHSKSIARWKRDALYGFRPGDELLTLAETYGYHPETLANETNVLWPVYRRIARGLFKAAVPALGFLHGIKRVWERRDHGTAT